MDLGAFIVAAQEEDSAATRIQALRRGQNVRRTIKAERGAAITIQAVHRGKQARKSIKASESAAVQIQAHIRGRSVRRSLLGSSARVPGPDFQKVRTEAVESLKAAGWVLASREQLEGNLDKVKTLLGQWDVCMIADGWKIDGAGYGFQIQKNEGNQSLGDAIIVKFGIVQTPEDEFRAKLLKQRSHIESQPGNSFESAPQASVADARSEWIVMNGSKVGWSEVERASSVPPKKFPAAHFGNLFQASTPAIPEDQPLEESLLDPSGFATPEDSDKDDLIGWDNSSVQDEAEELSGEELKELMSKLQAVSQEDGRQMVKKLPRGKVLFLARLIIEAKNRPQKKGWLSKRGPSSSYGWQRRWCVLSHSGLDYYADEAERQKKGNIRFGPATQAVAFRSCEGAERSSKMPYGFCLQQVYHPDVGGMPRLFYFDAESEEALLEWTRGINAMAQQ